MSDFVFERAVKVGGAWIAPYTANGYHLTVWSKLRPFEGTCDIHLLAFDVTDGPEGSTSYAMPEQVTRHYAEIYVVCLTSEVKEHWDRVLEGAKRTYVVLEADHRARSREIHEQHAEAKRSGLPWDPTAFLRTPVQELREIEALNYTANSELRKAMDCRYFDPFPFAPKNPDGSLDWSKINIDEPKDS